MMVSTAMAVLPVPRSPMMSSRWPRPSGIMASMTSSPVASGRVTSARSTIAGAGCSTGANSVGLERLAAVERQRRAHRRRGRAAPRRPARARPRRCRGRRCPPAMPLGRRRAARSRCVCAPRSTARPRTPPSKTSNSSSRVSGRPRHGRHAVADLSDPADLLEPRLERAACRAAARLRSSQARRSSASVGMGARSPRARPRARSARRSAEWRPGNAAPRRRSSAGSASKRTAMPSPSEPAQPLAPGLARRRRQRRRGHDGERCAVRAAAVRARRAPAAAAPSRCCSMRSIHASARSCIGTSARSRRGEVGAEIERDAARLVERLLALRRRASCAPPSSKRLCLAFGLGAPRRRRLLRLRRRRLAARPRARRQCPARCGLDCGELRLRLGLGCLGVVVLLLRSRPCARRSCAAPAGRGSDAAARPGSRS